MWNWKFQGTDLCFVSITLAVSALGSLSEAILEYKVKLCVERIGLLAITFLWTLVSFKVQIPWEWKAQVMSGVFPRVQTARAYPRPAGFCPASSEHYEDS